MTEYRFHWLPRGAPTTTPSLRLAAQSDRHGAALALRLFRRHGCDITALAHLDVTDARGNRRILMVDEIVEWLRQPDQAVFVQSEGLSELMA